MGSQPAPWWGRRWVWLHSEENHLKSSSVHHQTPSCGKVPRAGKAMINVTVSIQGLKLHHARGWTDCHHSSARRCMPGVAAGVAATGVLPDGVGAAAFGASDSGTLPAVGCPAARTLTVGSQVCQLWHNLFTVECKANTSSRLVALDASELHCRSGCQACALRIKWTFHPTVNSAGQRHQKQHGYQKACADDRHVFHHH